MTLAGGVFGRNPRDARKSGSFARLCLHVTLASRWIAVLAFLMILPMEQMRNSAFCSIAVIADSGRFVHRAAFFSSGKDSVY
jgi:hypothetical protein